MLISQDLVVKQIDQLPEQKLQIDTNVREKARSFYLREI